MYQYINGNYEVNILSDGTKIRLSDYSEYIPVSPESIDLKITNCCDLNCSYCHEESHLSGSHGNILNQLDKFSGLFKGTEIAIGGGNPLSHPDLINFICELNKKEIICNITINALHLHNSDYLEIINYLADNNLIYGIGISYSQNMTTVNSLNMLISKINKKDNIIVHVIAGIVDIDSIINILITWKKVLILGYKCHGRGTANDTYITNTKFELLNKYLESLLLYGIVSFDNLAINQLNLKDKIPKKMYDAHYMGNDGKFTMYVDLVKEQFAASSISNRIRMDDKTIKQCFHLLQ